MMVAFIFLIYTHQHKHNCFFRAINVMFTNADQLTVGKKVELIKRIEREKPLIFAVCEMEPKNSKQCEMVDYNISDYSIHPVNLDPNNSG